MFCINIVVLRRAEPPLHIVSFYLLLSTKGNKLNIYIQVKGIIYLSVLQLCNLTFCMPEQYPCIMAFSIWNTMTHPSDECYSLRLRNYILGLLQFLKLKYLCGSYRGRELGSSPKGKGEFLMPQEACGGLHTHMTSSEKWGSSSLDGHAHKFPDW